ncbi:MAG TPA: glutamate mutase L [Mycobacteriales bacterium]|nr:glutamate mutase L [Mycobacteriales bacterium]
MTRCRQPLQDPTLLVDVGSTYTKAILVDRFGRPVTSHMTPTAHADLDRGFGDVRAAVESRAGVERQGTQVLASSSAAGGLRLLVVGLEPDLTVRLGQLAAATAGGRVSGAYGLGDFLATTPSTMDVVLPDIVLLTGGTDGGDGAALPAAAGHLRALGVNCPVVVAGNQQTYPLVRAVLDGAGVVRYVPNVLPRLGVVNLGPARSAIREVFIEHVIGTGRLGSAAALAAHVVMPTPGAVLAATELVGELGEAESGPVSPLVVDVGGATTDVHSYLSPARHPEADTDDVAGGLRTVEADLGMRESALSLVQAAEEDHWVGRHATVLRSAADELAADRAFVPADPAGRLVDRQLGTLATAIGLSRHCGRMRIEVAASRHRARPTGRDLRRSGLVIATGGVFRGMSRPQLAVRAALRLAAARGALVPQTGARVAIDTGYVLWAVGLLSTTSRDAAKVLLGSAVRLHERR